MILGVTGSEYGCNAFQRAALAEQISRPNVAEVHHGDCVGVDAIAHELAIQCRKLIVIHPPDDDRKRAWCGIDHRCSRGQVTWCEPKSYLDRNRDIVACSEELVAVPIELQMVRRSGTWATVRYARRALLPITIIYSDGRIKYESAT